MDTKIFLDCLGREIKVGDVIVHGHRVGSCSAGVTVGVVTGFKDDKILATKYARGQWYNGVYRRYWTPDSTGDTWRAMNGYWKNSDQCFITGMTEADLRRLLIKIEESEEPQCVGSD